MWLRGARVEASGFKSGSKEVTYHVMRLGRFRFQGVRVLARELARVLAQVQPFR